MIGLNEEIVVPVVFALIPVVAIMTRHQQKMTEIIHRDKSSQLGMELDAVKSEMRELKTLIHQQTIMLDNLTKRDLPVPSVMVGYKEPVGNR